VQLAGLNDVFYKLNTLNSLLQGGNNSTLHHNEQFFYLLGRRYIVDTMENANVNTFLTLRKLIESNIIRIGEVVKIFKLSHIS